MKLPSPYIFHLRRNPLERAETNSDNYAAWMIDHVPSFINVRRFVAAQIENFINYPPRQKAASFSLDAVMAALEPQKVAAAAAASKMRYPKPAEKGRYD